jgi:hypothetical protein
MKPSEIYTGLRVVTTDAPNATVYTICEIIGFSVNLTYALQSGETVDGGWIDASYLRLPTIQQMAN